MDVTPVEAKALLDFRASVACEHLISQARGSHAAPQVAFRLSGENHPPGSSRGSPRTVGGSAGTGCCSFLYWGMFLWCLILLLPQGCVQEVWPACEPADVGLLSTQHGDVLLICR